MSDEERIERISERTKRIYGALEKADIFAGNTRDKLLSTILTARVLVGDTYYEEMKVDTLLCLLHLCQSGIAEAKGLVTTLVAEDLMSEIDEDLMSEVSSLLDAGLGEAKETIEEVLREQSP